MEGRRMIRDWVGLLLVSVVLGISVNALRPGGIPLVGRWETPPENGMVADALGNVSFSEARRLWRDGALFIDARIDTDYASGHVPGALSLPVAAFDRRMPDMFDRIAKASAIVVYCSGPDCPDGHTVGRFLSELGIGNIRVFTGGYPAWEKEGLDVERN